MSRPAWRQRRETLAEFIVERTAAALRFEEPRWWGKSSDALVSYALGGPWPEPCCYPSTYPSDPGDLASCWLTWCRLPVEYADRAAELYAAFREVVEVRYPKARMWPADECWQLAEVRA